VKNIGHLLFSLGLIAAGLCYLDTAEAQTNTVVATPQQLTFNTQTGVTTPSQTILLSSSSGTANVSITAHSDTGWLAVTSSSTTTPAVLTVSIGAGAPTSGVDVGFINILSGTTNLSVPVTLNANSTGGTSPISASPNSLSFVFANGATAAETQNVQLSSSSSSVTNYTATSITNSGTPWLSVNPTAGSLPGTLQVSVNPISLLSSPGTFSAAVAINAPGTNGISIPVLVTIQGQPSLNVLPAKLSFGYQLGTAAPEAETLTLSSSTGANVSFSATAQTTNCGNWIVLNQNSGATPSTLSVEVNTSGLTAGTCTGQINISAPGASNPSVTVPVSLLVSTLPLIQVPSTGPTFTYQIGGASPAPQSVQITSSTSGLNVAASASPDNGGPNFLEITSATGATPLSLTLTVNPTVLQTLGPGTYTETVTLAGSGAGNSPQSFDVTLTVSSNPILIGSVQSLNFNYQVGQTAPSNQTITITSSGAPLNYQVAVNATSCSGFLKATPSNGSTFGNQNQVVVSVNPQGIAPQVCSGNVTLTVPGSTAAPLVIPVTFNVSTNALLSVSQSAINITTLAGSAATTQTVSVTSTNNTALAFSATATTNPAGLTWLSVTPNNGDTPNNLQVRINPASLAAGVYSGSIVVSSSASNVPSQTIPVTLTIFASTAVAAPTSLTFSQAAGGTAPDSQSVQIAGVPSGTTIGVISTVLSGAGWLTATASGDTVTVTANGSQLTQGTYSGVVTVIVPGAGASPLYIPVTLNITAATSAITLSTSSLSFNVLAGSMSIPGTQTVQVTSSATGTSVPFTATFVPSTGGNFLTVTPSSGNTPATIALSVDAAVSSMLAAGTYSGDVQVSSGTGAVQTVKVTLLVSPAGTPVVLDITSGASLQPGAVSPGEIVTIFGNGIGPVSPATGTSFEPTASGTVPTTLANVTITFNSVPAPLIFVAQGQINAIVPYEVAGQTSVPVVVTNNGTASATFSVPVTTVTPSIFSLSEGGSGQGAILNSDASINGASNPAAPGSIISIYATGEGQLVPAGKTGCITGGALPLPKPVASVAVTIGGEAATSIPYAGEAPDSVCGLIQINATLPSDLAAGAQPVVLTFGTASNTGQSITVAVK
jgi:trimeric autotransporter adhesin